MSIGIFFKQKTTWVQIIIYKNNHVTGSEHIKRSSVYALGSQDNESYAIIEQRCLEEKKIAFILFKGQKQARKHNT